MASVKVLGKEVTYAVCIPSRGRASLLLKTLVKMEFLGDPSTFIGYERREEHEYYANLRATNMELVTYDNPTGSVAVAREALRRVVTQHTYDYVVVTDDNAHYTKESVDCLVATLHAYRVTKGILDCVMSGMHSTEAHFDRHRIAATEVDIQGFRSYQHFGMIFQVYPMSLYKQYTYPPDAYGLDDRHLLCWAINRGLPAEHFRVAMDAPFTKSRYQEGGQGTVVERARKCGLAIARLATDFPSIVGAKGTLPIAWQTAFALREGKTLDRLAGGAMRKEDALVLKGPTSVPPMRIRRHR